jgi:hypothetical protein
MASEAALHTHYIGKVLPDGHLEIPKTIVEHLGGNVADLLSLVASYAIFHG